MASDIDIEKLAREAGFRVIKPALMSDKAPLKYRLVAFPAGENCLSELHAFAALVLEEAATKAESSVAEFGVNSEWTHGYVEGVKDCASGMRTIAEGLKG